MKIFLQGLLVLSFFYSNVAFADVKSDQKTQKKPKQVVADRKTDEGYIIINNLKFRESDLPIKEHLNLINGINLASIKNEHEAVTCIISLNKKSISDAPTITYDAMWL